MFTTAPAAGAAPASFVAGSIASVAAAAVAVPKLRRLSMISSERNKLFR
jgi:hypothetical protein